MRIRMFLLSALILAAGLGALAQGPVTHLMRHADVHGDTIVFTYEGDLWLVPTSGGEARRLTSDPGEERFAKFSPDGRKIAFTASYDGGVDVYVMDARGGVPTRLTFHPAADLVLGWFPDGEHILFRTRRDFPDRGEQIYRVSIKGGLEERLAVDRAGLTAIAPDGDRIAYCRITGETATWKRHQGGDAQDIWIGSLSRGDFKKMTDWKGMDNYPMWEGDYVYFSSDREAGTLNIFQHNVKNGETKALTHYTDYDVKYPSIGPGAIVYQYAEQLYLLDLKTGQSRKVDAQIPSDRVKVRPDYVSPTANVGVFGLSPDGERLLLETRGEVVSVPAEKGPTFNLTKSSGSREKNPAWSPDGKWVAFLSDKTGEEEVYIVDAKGERPWKQLTTGGKGFRLHLVWSPDGKWLLFSDKFMRLNLVDASTGALTVVDQGEYDDGWERWGIQDYVWSPDSKWIAYTKKMENTNEVILLYGLDTKKISPVTDDSAESWSPSFDPKGRYLYFLSNRTYSPVMGVVDQEHIYLNMTRPYVVVLKAGEPSPFSPEAEEGEKTETKSPGAQEPKKNGDKEKEKPEASGTVIDVEGIGRRTVAAPDVEAGRYFRLEATDKGFLYLSMTEPEFENRYAVINDFTDRKADLVFFDLKEKKTSDGLKAVNNYHLSADRKKLVYRANGKFGIVDVPGKGKTGDGAVDLAEVKIKVDKLAEFLQIFNEAWRVERDFFYDPNLHKVDWAKTGEMYRRFVPECGNRSDVNYLIGEMIAELNSGHTYIYGGDDDSRGKRIPVGVLGCDFDTPEGSPFHRIKRIVPGKPWNEDERSPFTEPGCPVKEGDYLIAIDGEKITSADNPFKFLEQKAGRVVTVTYNSKPSEEGAKSCRVKTLRGDMQIRYRDWVETNYAKVQKASDGVIGYIHLPDMGEEGLVEFGKAFFAQYPRRALIIDVRYNGGGFVGDMIISRLERQVWSMTQPREGRPCRNPEEGFYGHLVVIQNEDTGSNGEFFTIAIKKKNLAKVYGMRTWGGSNGIEPHQILLDGATCTPPQFGLYGLDRKWLFEGHGVDPDVEVQNMPGDVLKGKDAQLDAAVNYLLEELRKDPKTLPAPPPYVDKARPKGSDLGEQF